MFEVTPLFLYESFILVIGTSAVIAFAVFYFRLLRGYHVLRKKYLEIESNTKNEVDQLMKRTHQQAIATIEHSQTLSDELKKQLTQILQNSISKESTAYRQVMAEVGEDIKEESEQMLDNISKEVTEDVVEAHDSLQARIEKKYQVVDQEIEQYKKQRMQEVEQKLGGIVQEVLEHVSGKSLSLEQHQELIHTAIDQAKHEHIL